MIGCFKAPSRREIGLRMRGGAGGTLSLQAHSQAQELHLLHSSLAPTPHLLLYIPFMQTINKALCLKAESLLPLPRYAVHHYLGIRLNAITSRLIKCVQSKTNLTGYD